MRLAVKAELDDLFSTNPDAALRILRSIDNGTIDHFSYGTCYYGQVHNGDVWAAVRDPVRKRHRRLLPLIVWRTSPLEQGGQGIEGEVKMACISWLAEHGAAAGGLQSRVLAVPNFFSPEITI